MVFATLVLLATLGGCMRNDAGITSKVQQQLSQARLPNSIVVTTSDGVVTLAGTVGDTSTKQHAEQLALEVNGVRRVVNDIHTTMAGDAPAAPVIAPNRPAAPPPQNPENMPNVPPNPPNPPSGQQPSE